MTEKVQKETFSQSCEETELLKGVQGRKGITKIIDYKNVS